MEIDIWRGDCLDEMRALQDNSVDLVFCSPPYESARTYGIDFKLRGQDWVDWALERYLECVRISNGLVAWVVEGQTRQFRYTATPALLMADLHRAGVQLRKPPIFHRVGIPGSGGPDWLRNDYEFVICASKGKLPWSDNTAMGHPPKWAVGGEMSNRHADGIRINAQLSKQKGKRPSHVVVNGRDQWGGTPTKSCGEGRKTSGSFKTPSQTQRQNGEDGKVKANPGNVVKCNVGGGVMGSRLAHENEAPFPEKLAEFFIRSFCRPGGTVLDPFCGSGTTLAVAAKTGRKAIGIDIREFQVQLSSRRIAEVQK